MNVYRGLPQPSIIADGTYKHTVICKECGRKIGEYPVEEKSRYSLCDSCRDKLMSERERMVWQIMNDHG